MYRLFIVEDDDGIAEGISSQASMWGIETVCANDFQNVISQFTAAKPHIVLLDISLPFYNGYHWCSQIRRLSSVPIIFLSSASDSMNIIMAMNMGADDFITKPFDMSVLMAKVMALLRRTYDFLKTLNFGNTKGQYSIFPIRLLHIITKKSHFQKMNSKFSARLWNRKAEL